MRFLVITHVKHIKSDNKYYAYAPYVREMNLWFKHVNEVEVVAPISNKLITNIDSPYIHEKISFKSIPSIQFTNLKQTLLSLTKLPLIFWCIFKACKRADHIHLRCPGNIGLIGCVIQILFPKKIKTAKYAGNWDPKSKQPLSYRIQKKILSNTFFTKNMSVLVYGEWKKQTKNIIPFFTASFYKREMVPIEKRDYKGLLNFVFIGTLVDGKQPLYSIKIIEELVNKGLKINMTIFGDGILKQMLVEYVNFNKLDDVVFFEGNQTKDLIKKALNKAHFLLLPSKSEGWPKVVAEAMFFGVIPIVTEISCVPYMLDYGKRGIIINNNIKEAINKILDVVKFNNLQQMQAQGVAWSHKYTLDYFEEEITKLLV